MMKETIFNDLNPHQKKAVTYYKGPSVILAGAGSGKTRVLTNKVLYLVEEKKVDPASIVMITFTNKAANEMKSRIQRLFNEKDKKKLGYVGTFHSFCAMILRRDGYAIGLDQNFVIYDDQDQTQLARTIITEAGIEKMTPSHLLNRISNAKNQLISPSNYLTYFSDYLAPVVSELYTKYEKRLKKNNAVDFDDLLLKVVTLFRDHKEVLLKYQQRYTFFLIDEFQDTNIAQYTLTQQLASRDKNITVVGDFSQSIYSWRGADIKNLEKFQTDFPGAELFYLEENYRSTQTILNFAYDIISQNQTHPILKLHTNNKEGEEVVIYEADNEQEEAFYVLTDIERLHEDVPYSSFAVLYRTNAQSRIIEEAFLHRGIPYVLIGGTRFYERKEIKDVLSYLRLFANPVDEIAKVRIEKLGKKRYKEFAEYFRTSFPSVKDKDTAELMEEIFTNTHYLDLYDPDNEEDYGRLENIKELKSVALEFPNLTQFLEQVALVESEYFEGEKKGRDQNGVRLMTLHQAKGLEFPYVYIVGLEEGILPHARSIDDLFSLEEERRLFYVGVTRAEKKLVISYARRRFIFGRRNDSIKSRFIGGESYV